MKKMYKVYTRCSDLVGLFCDEATRDRQIKMHGGSYKTIKIRSVKRIYKDMKGYDILMTARELGKMMDYIGGGGSMFPAEELEEAVSAFMDKYGNKDDMTTYNNMMSDIFGIAETERHNAFTMGFETAVSLILSRELAE